MPSSDLSDLSLRPAAGPELTPEQKDRLTDVLDGYLSALESGLPPPREQLFEDHPDLAGPLRAYLTSLEALHEVAAGFGNTASTIDVAGPASSDENRLGDFVLVREIGRGGMGVVYEARQISLGRRVALKVLPFAAVLDSKQLIRFKHEAQAAAQLHHPNIVPVFAIGAERGVHYYAMQYIDGQPLDRAIVQLRKRARLPVEEMPPGARSGVPTADAVDRLSSGLATIAMEAETQKSGVAWEDASTHRSILTEHSGNRTAFYQTVLTLGIQAAEALQAAHEYGVIHRDIKPSNLLLDNDGKLWVADFGLARCQTDLHLTKTGDVVGTMRYMSPEQAAGQSALVDQRSDIYALGTTLYELLTLRPAFPAQHGAALARQIEQQEPIRLRHFQPQLPADLETVILKAMSKRREERYSTAHEFAEDLRRVLEGKPTLAKPPTLPDRLSKWARRHKRLMGASVAVGLLALAGLATSTFYIAREKARAEQNYTRAETHFRQARRAVDHFGTRLAERLADVPGAEQVRRELLQDTLQYYQDFVRQADKDPTLRADLAMAYTKMGTIAGEIGSTDAAIAAYQDAEKILNALAAARPQVVDHRRHLAQCRNNLALWLRRAGCIDEARRAYREAIRTQQELIAQVPEEVDQLRADLALSHNNLGLLQSETGDNQSAVESFRAAIRIQQQLVDAAEPDPEQLRSLAASYNNLAALQADAPPAQATELYSQALACQQQAADARPDAPEYRGDLASTHNNLGAVQSRARQFAEAATSYRRAIEIQQALVQAFPARTSYRRDLAVSYNNLGLTQTELGQSVEAEASFRLALQFQELLVGQQPREVGLQSSLGGICNNLGIVLEGLHRLPEAAAAYQQAVTHQQAAFARASTVDRYRLFLSKHYYNYGRVLRQLGKVEQAVQVALARRELWPQDPQRLFTVAEELALSAKLSAGAEGRETRTEQCAAAALETLRQAIATGLPVPTDLDRNEAFATLKDRAEFAAWVRK